MRRGGLAALALCALACAPGGLEVRDAVSYPAAEGPGVVYLTVVDGGSGDRLLSAETPAAGQVMLHESVQRGDAVEMRAHGHGFPVPAGGELRLEPGGKHLMLMDLVAPLAAGQDLVLTLHFERAGDRRVVVPVRER